MKKRVKYFKMSKNSKVILSCLFILSLLIVFYKLGSIPAGISVDEARFGLKLSPFLGSWFLDPFWVRFPNALTAISVIVLFQVALVKLKFNFKTATVAAFILLITPWFILQSRILSIGIFISPILLLILSVASSVISRNFLKTGTLLILLSLPIFTSSLFKFTDEIKITVDQQRNILSKATVDFPPVLLTNKFIESYRFRQKLLFENLDFGNYFFKGHPRERGGVEETQKLLIVFLPLFIFGLFKISKHQLVFLFGWWSLTISALVFFGVRSPEPSFILIFPIITVAAEGVRFMLDSKKVLPFCLISFLILIELSSFITSYFSGFNESLFTPRRAIFKSIVPRVLSLSENVDKVVVSERLGNPRDFFIFYSKDPHLAKFYFRAFDFRRETDKNTLFVDVLPDDPSPSEPLYKMEGGWPDTINTLAEFRDDYLRQKIVIFKLK